MSAETILPALVIGTISAFATAVDGITGTTTVPLGLAAGIFVTVAPAIWWLGSKFAKIDTRLENVDIHLKNIDRSLAVLRKDSTDSKSGFVQ